MKHKYLFVYDKFLYLNFNSKIQVSLIVLTKYFNMNISRTFTEDIDNIKVHSYSLSLAVCKKKFKAPI